MPWSNMDTLGLTLPEVSAGHSDQRLTGALVFIAKKMNVPVTAVNGDQSTDSVQFSELKIPSITIHSLTQETWNGHILHTFKDKLSLMHLDDYVVSAYLAFLDQVADASSSAEPQQSR